MNQKVIEGNVNSREKRTETTSFFGLDPGQHSDPKGKKVRTGLAY